MKNVALATEPKIIAFTRRAEVAVEEPLQFFIVPTDYKGFMWLIKNRILGRKLTGPSYNKHYNTLTGSMQEWEHLLLPYAAQPLQLVCHCLHKSILFGLGGFYLSLISYIQPCTL